MAITFPSSPSPGDIFTSNGKSWQYVNGKWESYGETVAPDVFAVDAANDVVHVYGSLSAGASASVDTDLVVGGDLTVDTSTLHVDSTNNRVGVGTAAPGKTLGVVGDASVSGDLYMGLDSTILVGDTHTFVASPPSATMESLTVYSGLSVPSGDFTVDTDTLHVDATNNRVGIGTTSPDTNLEVIGGFTVNTSGAFDTHTIHVDTANDWVGIGTNTPIAKLDVSGGINVQGQAFMQTMVVANQVYAPAEVLGDFSIGNTGSEAMYVDASAGLVGIGTTTPRVPLDINSTVGNQIIIEANASGSRSNIKFITDQTDWELGGRGSAAGDNFYIFNNAGPGYAFVIDSSNRIVTPDQPRFSTKRYGSVTLLAGVSTTIPFNENEYDVGSNYDKTTGIFTAPVAGLYHFETQLLVTKTTNSRVDLKFLLNGSNHWIQEFQGLNTTAFNLSVNGSMTVELSANDNVRVQATCVNADGNVYANSQRVFNWFSGFLIG